MTKKRKKKTTTTKTFNWGVAVGLLLAFLAGGVIGAVVERERVLNTSDETAAASAQSASWFTRDLANCAPLQRWSASRAATNAALLRGAADWGASRATLVQQSSEGTAALQSLLPLVTPAGRDDIQSLIAHEGKVRAALADASSVAAYSASLAKLDSEQTTQSTSVLARAVQYCPPS
jgi:hypothetical protein